MWAKSCWKRYIGKCMLSIDTDIFLNLRLKVSLLLEEFLQRMQTLLDIITIEGRLRWVVRDLDQPGVSESSGARKFINPEIDCWLWHKHDA